MKNINEKTIKEDFYKELGKRIKLVRNVQDLSIKDVAKELNMSFQQYQKYESGKNQISIYALFVVLPKILKCPAETIIDFKQPLTTFKVDF